MSRTLVFAALLAGTTLAGVRAADGTADMDANHAVDMFLDEFGYGLTVEFDFKTGRVTEIFGRPMDLGWSPSSDVDFELAARDLIDRYGAMFGYDTGALAEARVHRLRLAHIGSSDKVAVTFDQEIEGIDVQGGGLCLLFLQSGALISISNRGIPEIQNLDLEPRIDQDQALRIAEAHFGHELSELRSLDIAIVADTEERGPALAWNVELRATITPEDGVPIQERISVDAHDGRVIRGRTTVHTAAPTDLIGRVRARVSPGNDPEKGDNEVTERLHLVHVDSAVGSADTDIDGNFTIAYSGNQDQDVTVDFDNDSRHAYVLNDTGGEMKRTKTVTPGVLRKWKLNNKGKQKKTAQTNAHKHIVRMIEFIRGIDPSDGTLDRQFRTNVNINSCCNAYYDGSSTNYYLAGCGCVNTAYSTVVYHELGHWANDLYGSGNGRDGFGEGNADNFATHTADDPIVGKDFCGTGCHVRDGRNGRQYCNNSCGSGCYGGVHADGEVLMGAMWKVRTRLNGSHGDAAGDLVSNTLFVAWMNAYNDGAICENVRTHYLILDDIDGNIDNGTPNSTDIDEGFKDQGFPGYY